MTVQTITKVVSKTRLYPPTNIKTPIPEETSNPDDLDQIGLSDDLLLCDALKSTARKKLPPICWDDALWRSEL